MSRAIDTSYWQGHPDFTAVKADGVSLVIMKAADGEGSAVVNDSVYIANRAAARAQGLGIGSYYFNGPAVSPAAAADHMMEIIDWHDGDVVAIDVEGTAGIVWNAAQVLEWVNRIKAHGVPPQAILVYMSSSVTKSQNWAAVVATGAGLWVAQYGSNNGQPQGAPSIGYWPTWTLWQYTSMATCAGIAGRVDTNLIAAGWSPAPPRPKEHDMIILPRNSKSGAIYWEREPGAPLWPLSPDEFAQISANNGAQFVDFDDATMTAWLAKVGTAAGPWACAPATSVDVAPIVAAVMAAIKATGIEVDDAAIASAVKTALKPDFAAVPAAVVKATGAALSNG